MTGNKASEAFCVLILGRTTQGQLEVMLGLGVIESHGLKVTNEKVVTAKLWRRCIGWEVGVFQEAQGKIVSANINVMLENAVDDCSLCLLEVQIACAAVSSEENFERALCGERVKEVNLSVDPVKLARNFVAVQKLNSVGAQTAELCLAPACVEKEHHERETRRDVLLRRHFLWQSVGRALELEMLCEFLENLFRELFVEIIEAANCWVNVLMRDLCDQRNQASHD